MPSITSVMDGISMALVGDEGATAKIEEGINGLAEKLNNGLPIFLNFITKIANVILENAPMIIETLANGIMTALPTLIPTISNIVINIVQTLISMLPQLLDMGIQLLLSLIDRTYRGFAYIN